MKKILVATCIFLCLCSNAQVADSILQKEIPVSSMLEGIAERSDAEIDVSDLTDELKQLQEKPVHINSKNENEIRRLFFLNELQQKNLMDYVYKQGNIVSIYELNTIEGFNEKIISELMPYITLSGNKQEKPTLKKILKYGKTDVLLRMYRQLQQSSAYNIPDNTSKSKNFYLGNPNAVFMRLQFKYKDFLKTGLVAEKDAGEPFWTKNDSLKKGFDFYSFHLFLNNVGKFKHIAIGDYHLKLGQGLNAWTGFAMSKFLGYTLSRKRHPYLSAHASANEINFLRGAAATYNHKNIDITAFFSYKYIDASFVTDDTLVASEKKIRSLQETGYHRTISEINNKGKIGQIIAGSYLKYLGNKTHIGLTALHINHNKEFAPPTALYKKFEPSLKQNTYLGLDYGFIHNMLTFYGEGSYQAKKGFAFLQGLSVMPSSRISLSVLYRNYAKNYYNMMSNAFGEATHNSNEEGLYIGIDAYPYKKIFVTAYADLYKFPWLKYRIDAPSNGAEYGIQATYSFSKNVRILSAYRYRKNAQNITTESEKTRVIGEKHLQNIRIQLEFDVFKWLSFQHRLEIAKYKIDEQKEQNGYLIFQNLKIAPGKQTYRLYLRYSLFDNRSYEARIYAYENDFIYAFSIPSFYGKGSSMYALLQINLYKSLDLGLRYAQTWYAQRGNAQNEENENFKSSIKAQLHWRF